MRTPFYRYGEILITLMNRVTPPAGSTVPLPLGGETVEIKYEDTVDEWMANMLYQWFGYSFGFWTHA